MIVEKILSERYAFREKSLPYRLSDRQKEARRLFLSNIHRKNEYVSVMKCPYCGREDFLRISEIDRRGLPSDIVICNACDGCFKAKTLSRKANQYHYKTLSYALRGKISAEEAVKRLFAKRRKLFAYPRYKFITHFIDFDPAKDLIVEFGCNDGANLAPWVEKGFKAFGIELDPEMARFGAENGLDIRNGDLTDLALAEKPKLVILTHILEHVADINLFLGNLHDMLRHGGYVFVEVPGVRTQGLSDPLECFDVEHNYYFDKRSLSGLMKKHGFEMMYSDEYMRFLCRSTGNTGSVKRKGVPFSLNKIYAVILGAILAAIRSKEEKLYDLLKETRINNLKRRITGKLLGIYYRRHYLSITARAGDRKNYD